MRLDRGFPCLEVCSPGLVECISHSTARDEQTPPYVLDLPEAW
jgi:hypothetical protein